MRTLVFVLLAFSAQSQLSITEIADSMYVYTTYKEYNGTPFPSNSMFVITDGGVFLFDTPWDTEQLPKLLDTIQAMTGRLPVMSYSTHFHEDRTAGVDYLDSIGVETYCSSETQALCKINGVEAPRKTIDDKMNGFRTPEWTIEVYFPGPGHTLDNTMLYFPRQKILYAGCFIKSIESKGLGYTKDADLKAWLKNAKKVKRKFKKAEIVIPGHQSWEGNPIEHTIELLKAERTKD